MSITDDGTEFPGEDNDGMCDDKGKFEKLFPSRLFSAFTVAVKAVVMSFPPPSMPHIAFVVVVVAAAAVAGHRGELTTATVLALFSSEGEADDSDDVEEDTAEEEGTEGGEGEIEGR